MASSSEPISLSSHILDTMRGCPAEGLSLRLDQHEGGDQWKPLFSAETNHDGRITDLPKGLPAGRYRAVFDTAAYFAKIGVDSYFSPQVIVDFLTVGGQHYHIPLLLSPFGYTTYRGS